MVVSRIFAQPKDWFPSVAINYTCSCEPCYIWAIIQLIQPNIGATWNFVAIEEQSTCRMNLPDQMYSRALVECFQTLATFQQHIIPSKCLHNVSADPNPFGTQPNHIRWSAEIPGHKRHYKPWELTNSCLTYKDQRLERDLQSYFCFQREASFQTSLDLTLKMLFAKSLSPFTLIMVALQTASAAPAPQDAAVNVPEVIPGPGLPSLESLGLTSEQLYAMGLPAKGTRFYPAIFSTVAVLLTTCHRRK